MSTTLGFTLIVLLLAFWATIRVNWALNKLGKFFEGGQAFDLDNEDDLPQNEVR